MKKIFSIFMMILLLLTAGLFAEAADPAMNRKLGYFDNTRTVLLLPARFTGSDYAASILNREMKNIFRYPYYRTLDTSDYAGMAVSPATLPDIADQTGADIVILPTLQWRQWIFHRYFFDDGDDIVQTRAIVTIYSYNKAEGTVRQDRGTYFDTEEEGFVRTVYIMDDLMKKVYKTFPYRRVPKDVSKSLTGETSDHTPKAVMKN